VDSAEAALERMRQHSYDAVLCDLHLGDPSVTPSPAELRRKLISVARASTGHVPLFIFMTGDLLADSDLEGLGDTQGRVILKPFRVSDLVTLLVTQLDPVTAKHTADSHIN
jgi:CheY-like chemotaxis protein